MRVYIATNVDELSLHTAGQWEPGTAYAVTDTLRDEVPELDEDELAEAAIDAAAMASSLLRGSRLRAVIAADVSRADIAPDPAVDPDAHPAAVRMAGRLERTAIACVFLDEEDAGADVAAMRGGDDAAYERLAERSLLWYDLGEVLH